MVLSVLIVAIALFSMGLAALISPRFIVSFFDGDASSINARNEIRAVYGGFGVSVAILLILTPYVLPSTIQGIYLTMAVALAGMAFGRLVSSALERPGTWPWIFFILELIAASVLGYNAFQH